jgi:hypothetical protein
MLTLRIKRQQVMKVNKLLIGFFFILLIVITGCKKIETPDEDSKQIFGEWNYSYNSGGFSGAGGSTLYNSNSWLEISDKGVFKVYQGSKKVRRLRFKIETNDGTAKYKLNFYSLNQLDYAYLIEDNQLILIETVSDGFIYVFERK